MATWHTSDTVRAEWEDADQIPDLLLDQLVIAARDAVIAYAPPLSETVDYTSAAATIVLPAADETIGSATISGTVTLQRSGLAVTAQFAMEYTAVLGESACAKWNGIIPELFRPASTTSNTSDEGESMWIEVNTEGRLTASATTDDANTVELAWLVEGVASIPDRYRIAQLIQVRNLWNATLATGSGDLGGDTYTFTPRPLDWHVKALLRPARGRPRVR